MILVAFIYVIGVVVIAGRKKDGPARPWLRPSKPTVDASESEEAKQKQENLRK